MTWAITVLYAKQGWLWLKQNLGFVLLCVVGLFGGAKLLRRKDSQINTLNEAIAAEKHKTEIARLKQEAEDLTKRDAESVVRDQALVDKLTATEAQMAEHKRRLLALHDRDVKPESMTDAEIEQRFKDAGL